MRYQIILGASVLASAAIIATPASVMSQTTTEKVEQKAEQAWTKTKSVKSVRNDLQVVPPGERKAVDTSDATITHQVQDRLAKNTQLTKVEVRTDSAVVILTGRVPSIAASARASEVARGVPSVRSVKNELTYDGGATSPQGEKGK